MWEYNDFMLTPNQIRDFIDQHHLPDEFEQLLTDHYLHVAQRVSQLAKPDKPALVGINGAQGTGKSTLAAFLKLELETSYQQRVAILSLDDFYLTRDARKSLAQNVHPLLATRGVPGTHDIPLLQAVLKQLQELPVGASVAIPVFNKVQDDREDKLLWSVITGPIDLILLEGWCVGSRPQPSHLLEPPINSLERTEDVQKIWRTFVNQQLDGVYANVFDQLGFLIFLQIPNMDAIFRWRTIQEEKLLLENPNANIMTREALLRFIMHYERITQDNLKQMPTFANLVIELNEQHQCKRRY